MKTRFIFSTATAPWRRIGRLAIGCLNMGCLALGCMLGGGLTGAVSTARAQVAPNAEPAGRTDREQLPQPIYKVANKSLATEGPGGVNEMVAPAVAPQHPLEPAIRLAKASLEHINLNINDYTATMVKHERINGSLQDAQRMFVKIRQQPFSVYMKFTGPKRIVGQEVIYVAGNNGGKMLARGVGLKRVLGMVSLDPNGVLAMQDQRYPITEIGFGNLTKRLIEVAEEDMKLESKYPGECTVEFHNGAKVDGRPCIGITVTHPRPRPEFKFNVAKIMLDRQLNVPVHYSARLWSTVPNGAPELLEEYTYVDIKINQGLNNADFDDKNPNYNFH